MAQRGRSQQNLPTNANRKVSRKEFFFCYDRSRNVIENNESQSGTSGYVIENKVIERSSVRFPVIFLTLVEMEEFQRRKTVKKRAKSARFDAGMMAFREGQTVSRAPRQWVARSHAPAFAPGFFAQLCVANRSAS